MNKSTSIELSKNDYIVIDPCYVMKDDLYNQMVDQMYKNYDANGSAQNELEIDGIRFAVFNTAHGDGVYQSNTNSIFSVDAGIIGAIPLSFCDETTIKKYKKLLSDECFFITGEIIAKSDGSTLSFNDLEIYTGYDEED